MHTNYCHLPSPQGLVNIKPGWGKNNIKSYDTEKKRKKMKGEEERRKKERTLPLVYTCMK